MFYSVIPARLHRCAKHCGQVKTGIQDMCQTMLKYNW